MTQELIAIYSCNYKRSKNGGEMGKEVHKYTSLQDTF